jgi:hypothetical protein
LAVTLHLKEDAELGSYNFRCYASSGGLGSGRGFVTVTPAAVDVALGGGSDPASPYTVTAVSDSAAVTVEDVFAVDVRLSADPAVNDFAAMQAYLTYDGELADPDVTGARPDGIIVSEEAEGRLFISRTGAPASVDENGAVIVSVPFTALAPGEALFSVEDPKASRTGEQNLTDAQAGDDLTVVIAGASLISFDADYAGAPAGYQLLKYKLDAKPGVVYTYNGEPMGYAYIGGAHYVTYIVPADVTESNVGAVAPTSSPAADPDGDINGDAVLEIVDAQIVYDLATGFYSNDAGFTALSLSQRLKADANGDGAVDTADVYAIQHRLHYGSWN